MSKSEKIQPLIIPVPERTSIAAFDTAGSNPCLIGSTQVLINERTYALFSREPKLYCDTQYTDHDACWNCKIIESCLFFQALSKIAG
jgi:hypothetical protein